MRRRAEGRPEPVLCHLRYSGLRLDVAAGQRPVDAGDERALTVPHVQPETVAAWSGFTGVGRDHLEGMAMDAAPLAAAADDHRADGGSIGEHDGRDGSRVEAVRRTFRHPGRPVTERSRVDDAALRDTQREVMLAVARVDLSPA